MSKNALLFALPPKVIYEMGLQVDDNLAQALFFFTYLTGARINEATDFIPSRLTVFPDYVKINMKTEKARAFFRRNRDIIIPLGKHAKCYENEMWDTVKAFMRGADPTAKIFLKWKNMSEYLARKITLTTEAQMLNEVTNQVFRDVITKRFNPHFLRHCRMTHMVDFYDLNVFLLCEFAGWWNIAMARRYVKIKDLRDALLTKAT